MNINETKSHSEVLKVFCWWWIIKLTEPEIFTNVKGKASRHWQAAILTQDVISLPKWTTSRSLNSTRKSSLLWTLWTQVRQVATTNSRPAYGEWKRIFYVTNVKKNCLRNRIKKRSFYSVGHYFEVTCEAESVSWRIALWDCFGRQTLTQVTPQLRNGQYRKRSLMAPRL